MTSSEREERQRYYPEDDRELSTAVLEAIEAQSGKELSKTDFQLYDDVDPDALDSLFRVDASSNTTVQFDTDEVTVTLWGDGAVQIRVTPRLDER